MRRKYFPIVVVMFVMVLGCAGEFQVFYSKPVVIQTRLSKHFEFLGKTRTTIFNRTQFFVKVIGYDKSEIARLGPGAEIIDFDYVLFEYTKTPVVGLVYEDNKYNKAIGVWAKTISITNNRDGVIDIDSFYYLNGNRYTSNSSTPIGRGYSSGVGRIPKPKFGNEFNIIFITCGSSASINIDKTTFELGIGAARNLRYATKTRLSVGATKIFTVRLINGDDAVTKTMKGRLYIGGSGHNPSAIVVLITPSGVAYL